jgi:predicted DsbA family dithiol-disulfide isomerase
MPTITVDIWSDLVCPWCYLGKRRFEAALAGFEQRESVTVRHRSFELDPSGPRRGTLTIPERMQRDLGLTAEQAAEGLRTITSLAAEAGLDYRLTEARPVNSFDVHRLLHLGEHRGTGDAVRERLMRAYTAEGADLGDHGVLARLAAEVGLDPSDVEALLDGDAFGDAVRADEALARRLGIRGVPTFVFDSRFAASGALPTAELADLLAQAWHHTADQAS